MGVGGFQKAFLADLLIVSSCCWRANHAARVCWLSFVILLMGGAVWTKQCSLRATPGFDIAVQTETVALLQKLQSK